MADVAQVAQVRVSPYDREVLVRVCPGMSHVADAAALLLRRREELRRAESRHAQSGIRSKRLLDEAIAREKEAALALKRSLADHWCPSEE